MRACFLAAVDAAEITLSPALAEAVASDFLVLHRQMRLIRDACAAERPLPPDFGPGAA